MPNYRTQKPAIAGRIKGFSRALPWALAALFIVSCSPSTQDPDPSRLVADSAWQRIEKDRQDLIEKRKQLAEKSTPPQANAELKRDVEHRSDDLSRRLVAFLNEDPPREKEPLSPRQAQAIRWKTEEDIYLARGYEQAGDFRRALDILEAAIALDTGHAELRSELARIRAARFVTAERFAQVKNGMSPDDVRALLGTPNPHNVREYLERGPGRGVIGWFYPKDDRGAAAGVWFTKDRSTPSVYRADFSAIQPEGDPRPAAPAVPAEPPPAPVAPGA